MVDQMERGPCYDELHTMGAWNEHFEGVASSGPDVLWQYRVTVDIDGTPVQLMGEGLSLEDAACDVLRQVAERKFS